MVRRASQNKFFFLDSTEKLSRLSATHCTLTDWSPESEIQKQNLWQFAVFRRGFTRCYAVKCCWRFYERPTQVFPAKAEALIKIIYY